MTTITSSGRPATQRPLVLVSGASGALGQAIAERIARDGTDLVLAYRNNRDVVQSLADRLPPGTVADPVQMDVADAASVDAAARTVQGLGRRLDAVVFAAGAHIAQPRVADIGDAEWRAVVETELFGFANVARSFIPLFRSQRGGAFVCVTTFANFRFTVGDALSSVPKAGVESLVRSIALEEGRHGIRANCVAPGIINAGLGAEFQRSYYDAQTWERVKKGVPLRRFGEAVEVADAVAFLASGQSAYITGNTLIVDGGMHL